MGNQSNTFIWRLKNSWFFILSFIPYLQWIPFFIINGKVPKKRWVILGFANILAIGVAIALSFMARAYQGNYRPTAPKGAPTISDFLGHGEWPDGYMDSPEYAAYEAAYDAYMATPEYIKYDQDLDRFYSTYNAINTGVTMTHSIVWFVFLIFGFFIERYKYLRALSVNENRTAAYGRLNTRMDMGSPVSGDPGSSVSQFIADAKPQQRVNPQANPVQRINPMDLQTPNPVMPQAPIPNQMMPQTPVVPNMSQAPMTQGMPQQAPMPQAAMPYNAGTPVNTVPTAVVNVNTASEAELMTLPGMKTIDAKKIISYRSQNGAFNSLDEFFQAFGAQPHILVKMQNYVTLGNTQDTTSTNTSAPVNRRFDF